MKKLFIFLSLVLLFNSCQKKSFDNKKELWAYIQKQENGYLQHKNVNGYDFYLLYKPIDLLVEQEIDTDYKSPKQLRNKFNRYLYFTLSISKKNKEILSIIPKNKQEFGAMVNQLAFGMENKVHLFTQAKDTINLLDYNYPRMYGMSRNTSILFVYPRDEKYLKGEFLNLTIGDLGTHTGEIKFKVPIKLIKEEPTLIFK